MSSEADDKKSWGSGGLFKHRAFGSLFLMLLTPVFCLTFWYTCKVHGGSFKSLFEEGFKIGAVNLIRRIWPMPTNVRVWKIIISYMVFQLALMRLVPGKVFRATHTPSGHVPIYNANGVQCYIITIATVFLLRHYGIFNPAEIYDIMGTFLSSMNLFAILFCAILTIKGLNFPSTKDSGSNGNIIIDFFLGN